MTLPCAARRSLWQWFQKGARAIGHSGQSEAADPAHMPEHEQRQTSAGHQKRVPIRKETDEQVCRQENPGEIELSLTGVMPGQHPRGKITPAQRFSEIQQNADITPAEIQTLSADGMASMPGFSNQKQRSMMQTGSQTQLNRKSTWIIQQLSNAQTLGKNFIQG